MYVTALALIVFDAPIPHGSQRRRHASKLDAAGTVSEHSTAAIGSRQRGQVREGNWRMNFAICNRGASARQTNMALQPYRERFQNRVVARPIVLTSFVPYWARE